MAKAKQVIKTTHHLRIKTNPKVTKTKLSKKGNHKRCPSCGRFI